MVPQIHVQGHLPVYLLRSQRNLILLRPGAYFLYHRRLKSLKERIEVETAIPSQVQVDDQRLGILYVCHQLRFFHFLQVIVQKPGLSSSFRSRQEQQVVDITTGGGVRSKGKHEFGEFSVVPGIGVLLPAEVLLAEHFLSAVGTGPACGGCVVKELFASAHARDVEPGTEVGRTEFVQVRVAVKLPVYATEDHFQSLHCYQGKRNGEVSLLSITPRLGLRPSFRWELERCGCLELRRHWRSRCCPEDGSIPRRSSQRVECVWG